MPFFSKSLICKVHCAEKNCKNTQNSWKSFSERTAFEALQWTSYLFFYNRLCRVFFLDHPAGPQGEKLGESFQSTAVAKS